MAALMELPVKFIWTHDAFRVGEDGPTHEPVEHEAQIRLMEKLQNLVVVIVSLFFAQQMCMKLLGHGVWLWKID